MTRRFVIAGAALVLSAAFLSACDLASEDARLVQMPAVVDASPVGIYTGTFTDTSGANPVTIDVTAIVGLNREMHIIFAPVEELHFAGPLSVSGTTLSASLTEFTGAVGPFIGPASSDVLALDATIVEGQAISGEFTVGSASGQFALDYQTIFETNSSLDRVAGIWMFDDAASGYSVTWEIDDQGELFGNDSNACVFNGLVSVRDSDFNAYVASVEVLFCGGLSGQYQGPVFLEAVGAPELNSMTVSLVTDTDTMAFTTVMRR